MAAALPTTIQPERASLVRQTTPRVLIFKAGDGYTQRAADGINAIGKEYEVEWLGTNTQILELVTHFEERAGYQSFTWTPPDDTTSYKWTCDAWSRSPLGTNSSRLTATFKLEFDL